MDIRPAPLEKKIEDFIQDIVKISPFYTHFSVDIADGKFVENKTIEIDEIPAALSKVNKSLLRKITFDFDLMVIDYKQALDAIDEVAQLVRVETVFPHASAVSDYQELADAYPEYSIGLAVDPTDSIDTIVQNCDITAVPSFQIMSVTPGMQGNPFLEDSLIKIEQLRMADYRGKIYLDGGVNDKTLPVILSKRERPDVLCIGSFLTRADDLQQRVKKLNELIQL